MVYLFIYFFNYCKFVGWGKEICQKLRDRGYWADLTDPCSGYPVNMKYKYVYNQQKVSFNIT